MFSLGNTCRRNDSSDSDGIREDSTIETPDDMRRSLGGKSPDPV